MTYNSSGGIGCVEDEEYREYLMDQSTASIDNDMASYCNPEHSAFQSFPRTSFTSFIPHDHSHNGHFTYDAALPVSSQQYSRFAPPEYHHSLVFSQYYPQNRSDIRSFQPFHGMTEPQLMISRGINYTLSQPMPRSMEYQVPVPTYSSGFVSPTTTSPSLSFMSSPGQHYPHPVWPRSTLTPPPEDNAASMIDDAEEKEEPYDKPYAQLIYAALLQAPGHRMLLRDIYDWFVQNTKKPRESGTNGWQNSIRHNLSMNQAFENDKNDPIANRGSRKANSVWVLTEEAIKHGVQSTTRFRKNNSSKKSAGNKVPALQRQRSGARGGRAAKRAAQLKRTVESVEKVESDWAELQASHSFNFHEHRMAAYQDDWCDYSVASPLTPEDDHYITPSYSLPQRSHFEFGEEVEGKYEADHYLDEEDQLRIILSQRDSEHVMGN